MTDNDTPQFVRASELYSPEHGMRYPHPDQQASHEEISEIFDLTGPALDEPDDRLPALDEPGHDDRDDPEGER